MNACSETCRSQKTGKTAPSKRRREKTESVAVSPSSCQDVRENDSSIRGNVVQEIWGATQRTVKLKKLETRRRTEDGLSKNLLSQQMNDYATNDSSFSSIGGVARKGTRNTQSERKNHFQMVMAELKSKSKPRSSARDHPPGRFWKDKVSPTTVQCILSNFVDQDMEPIGAAVNRNEDSFHSASGQGTPGTRKNWISKAAKFQKGSTGTGKVQMASVLQSPKRPFLNIISPGSKQPSFATEELLEEGNASDIGGKCLHGIEAGPHSRRGNRLLQSFRRRGAFEDLKLDRSGTLTFHMEDLFEESVDESANLAPDTRLVAQVQELLRAMDLSEDCLTSLRIQGEKNLFELRSEIRRLNEMVISMTHTQELRYRSLLDSLHENYRILGQVESGFDYFLTLLNRHERSSIRHKFSRCIFFLLDQTVASLLTIVYIITSVYSYYRFKRRVPNSSSQ